MENLSEKIYEKVLEISEANARQEEKLNSIDSHLAEINGKVHDHCERIKVLEKMKTYTMGIVVGVSIVTSIIWTISIKFF